MIILFVIGASAVAALSIGLFIIGIRIIRSDSKDDKKALIIETPSDAIKNSISVDWNLPNKSAANWAIDHALEINIDAPDEIKYEVARQTSEWILSGEGEPGFIKRLKGIKAPDGSPYFDPKTAKKIAINQSTIVFAHANTEKWVETGSTQPILLPGWHDGCRCYTQPYKMPDGESVIVWYTVNDQYVCTTPIETPFGTMHGCKDLHRRVISSGPNMGKKVKGA